MNELEKKTSVFQPTRVVFVPKDPEQLKQCCVTDAKQLYVSDFKEGDVTYRTRSDFTCKEKFKFYYLDGFYNPQIL